MKKIILLLQFGYMSLANVYGQVNPEYIYVEGYFKKDGTYVNGYYKTSPNETNRDNYTTKPNVNPWTGAVGYLEPDDNYVVSGKYEKKLEYLSPSYNKALEMNDKKKYAESLVICEKLLLDYEIPYYTQSLIGWNYIGLGRYDLAVKAFETVYRQDNKSYFVLSQLYVAYRLNQDDESAHRIEMEASRDIKTNNEFEADVDNIIRQIHLNHGFLNEEIMKLAFDRKDLYIGLPFLDAIYTCKDCKMKMLDPQILEMGEGALRKRFFLDEDNIGHIRGMEFLLSKTNQSRLEMILIELGFNFIGQTKTPILVKKGSQKSSTVDSDVYIKEKYYIMISNVDLDGDESLDYFKVTLRK